MKTYLVIDALSPFGQAHKDLYSPMEGVSQPNLSIPCKDLDLSNPVYTSAQILPSPHGGSTQPTQFYVPHTCVLFVVQGSKPEKAPPGFQ